MFNKAEPRRTWAEFEEGILDFWRVNDIFRRSVNPDGDRPPFVFYEGPPTANGLPHIGHVLPRAMKDLFPRFRTMTGHLVLRKAGWDTHGLPVELEVEKELGISGKPTIEEFGVDRFVAKCRESVFRYAREWERLTERIAFWLDLDAAYVTCTPQYIESVWWALRQIWDKGLLYQGHKVVPYCPRCGTSLSSHELAQGYAEVDDPSVFITFPLVDSPDTALVGWTTTPWTLPGNVAVAVDPDLSYVTVETDAGGPIRRYVLAESCVERVFGEKARVIQRQAGQALLGLRYEPPFAYLSPGPGAHRVIPGDFVTAGEGTGVVHLAPAFGEDDLRACQAHDLPVVQPVDAQGCFTEEITGFAGQFVKDADAGLIEDLARRDRLLKAETYRHSYPFCWRCDTPLLYYARTSWFIRTTAIRDRMLELNRTIGWHPPSIGQGRFGNFLENLVDWCLSRERYWGTPLPIWICEEGHQHCVGSYEELKRMAANYPGDQEFDPHKPAIDRITLACPECSLPMRRVPEVIDCWFDSGAMPFAQWHYPFENQEAFVRNFPADFICEAVDMTRGWFYSLLAISVLIFDRVPFRHCLVTEFGVDEQGLKMSKHKGNVLDPWVVLERQGADALRWFLYVQSPPWQQKRFALDTISELQNQTLGTLWNVYSFFCLYATIDSFDPRTFGVQVDSRGQVDLLALRAALAAANPLDHWLLSRLADVTMDVRKGLDGYEVMPSARRLAALVDDLSNWYVRRGRRRYWRSGEDADKSSAYLTLWGSLVTTARLMAPFVPFLSEEVYQGLVARPGAGRSVPLSVHLTEFPADAPELVDHELEEAMDLVRSYVGLVRAARNRAAVKTRQPLEEVVLIGPRGRFLVEERPVLLEILLDEVNVKRASWAEGLGDLVVVEVRPRYDRVGARLGPAMGSVAAALAARSAEVAGRLAGGQPVEVKVEGRAFTLAPGDLELRQHSRPGYQVEQEGAQAVALKTEVSRELLLEGLAREIIHCLQGMRRQAGLEVTDPVTVCYQGQGSPGEALAAYRDWIAEEVLARAVTQGPPPRPALVESRLESSDGHVLLSLLRPEQD